MDARQRRFALLSLVNHDANAGRLERRRGQPRPRTHPYPSNPSIVEPGRARDADSPPRLRRKDVGLGSSFLPIVARARRPSRARRRRCRVSHTPPRVAFRDRSTTGISPSCFVHMCRFVGTKSWKRCESLVTSSSYFLFTEKRKEKEEHYAWPVDC